jgi:hypothetical protein
MAQNKGVHCVSGLHELSKARILKASARIKVGRVVIHLHVVIKYDHGTILPLCITPSMVMAYILLLLNFVVNVCLENNTKSCAKEKHNQSITTKHIY